jgi:hypothetical protein
MAELETQSSGPTLNIEYEVETVPRSISQWKHSYDTVGQIFSVKFDINVTNPLPMPEILNLDLNGPLEPEIIDANTEETVSVDSTYEITQDDVVNQENVRLVLNASLDILIDSSDDSDDSDVESDSGSDSGSSIQSNIRTQSIVTIPNSFFDKLQGMHGDTIISTNRGPMKVADLVSGVGIKLLGSYGEDLQLEEIDFIICAKIPSQKWIKIPKSGIADYVPTADLIVRPGHEIEMTVPHGNSSGILCAKDMPSASIWSDITNENMMYMICTEKKTFITVLDLKVATLEYSELIASKIVYEVVD